jgi:hypothetical protein
MDVHLSTVRRRPRAMDVQLLTVQRAALLVLLTMLLALLPRMPEMEPGAKAMAPEHMMVATCTEELEPGVTIQWIPGMIVAVISNIVIDAMAETEGMLNVIVVASTTETIAWIVPTPEIIPRIQDLATESQQHRSRIIASVAKMCDNGLTLNAATDLQMPASPAVSWTGRVAEH